MTHKRSKNCISVDTHYHANIFGLRTSEIRKKKLAFAKWSSCNMIDIIISTEHTYKDPINAYLHLAECGCKTNTLVVPACEGISQEGVEIIFVFSSEEELVRAGMVLVPFGWKVADIQAIKQETNCLVIIPHPYTLGTTGAGRILEYASYIKLLEIADYIEIENGAYFAAVNLISRVSSERWVTKNLPWLMKAYVPSVGNLFNGIGHAIGSDAHFPSHQYRIGVVEKDFTDELTDAFAFLERKHRFSGIDCGDNKFTDMLLSIPESLFCSMREARIKKKYKA